MLRDLNEISDGKIYDSNDMVRAACNDCEGCHACCEKMGSSIVLDPLDMWRLAAATGKCFEELMTDTIELHVVEGLILPNLKMAGSREQCVFLDEAGRCSIHALRPGLCRAFPLGRIYEEQRIRYFLQQEACRKPGRSKVKISKWLDEPEAKKNERFLLVWHQFRRFLEKRVGEECDEQKAKTINLFVLNLFFVTPYETEREFYGQFAKRMEQAENVLQFCPSEDDRNFP